MRGISAGWKNGVLNDGRGGFPGWDGLLPRAGGMPSPGGMNVLPGWDDWLVELTAFPGRDDQLVGSQGRFSFLRPPWRSPKTRKSC